MTDENTPNESKLPALCEAMCATELLAVCEKHGILPAYVQIRMGTSIVQVNRPDGTTGWDHGPMNYHALIGLQREIAVGDYELVYMRGEGHTITEAVDCLVRRLGDQRGKWRDRLACIPGLALPDDLFRNVKRHQMMVLPPNGYAWPKPKKKRTKKKPAQLTIVQTQKEPNNE